MPEKPEKSAREIVEEVLTPHMTRELWTINCQEVLPFTLQDFAVGGLLPAMLYMFRWGYRRGQGTFAKTFGGERRKPTVDQVAEALGKRTDWFQEFGSPVGKAILSDILLCYCLENVRHETGRHQQVQRVFPTHYMASWIDLPESVGHLRNVPEMLVALLANQKKGTTIVKEKHEHSRFAVASNFADNLLLTIFGPGVSIRDSEKDLAGDQFSESARVGTDQLLAVRMAQACGSAPQKLRFVSRHKESLGRGSPDIPNQHPICAVAARQFMGDMRVFLSAYGNVLPRQSLLPMLESCVSIGLGNLLLSATLVCVEWDIEGRVPSPAEQRSWPLFVDCTAGVSGGLRRLAEESMEDCSRRLEQLPAVLMCIRLAGYLVRYNPKMRQQSLPESVPDASEWLNLLGVVIHGRHPLASRILDAADEKCSVLAERLEQDAAESAALELLKDVTTNPVRRLAQAVCWLMGRKLQGDTLIKCLDACLMFNDRNGLAVKRRVPLRSNQQYHKSGDVRSIVLNDTALDFLVHRHLVHLVKNANSSGAVRARGMSLTQFLEILEDRYGLFVDRAPRGISISTEQLLENKQVLERRLRDLGLLVGVNDAESMKRLQPRFGNLEWNDDRIDNGDP